jgi:hypothetical protein
MKIIAFDYSTALMSLILPIIFLAAIFIFSESNELGKPKMPL